MQTVCIEVKNLGLKLQDNQILEDINFEVKFGEYVSIVGPNGAGKSSLIKIILGLIDGFQGVVRICNNQNNLEPKKFVGYVPQIKTLDRNFPAIALELVANGLTGRWMWTINRTQKDICMEAMQQAGIEKLANRSLNTLSGGELQRVYLARALVRNPKILVFDEPATGIDAKIESDMCLLIDRYKTEHNAAILTVTHDWNSAFHHSDYVLMINRKQYCFLPPSEAFTDEILRELFGHIGHRHQMKFGVK